MAAFETPNTQTNPFVRAHFDRLNSSEKLCKYPNQDKMVCKDDGGLFGASKVVGDSLEHE
ncbi:hypothetical protein [Halocatena marina]|uniref:hypothetical protein n=1 Tax=Halocatena marina TaxID=2934937 RepID=UPI00200F4653|nr:hypothetical protein [Halocatena marina]